MELTPIAEQTTPLAIEKTLLTGIANEAHVSDWQKLRWFPVGGDAPRSIVVVTRGKDSEQVCTISRTNNPEAWQTWQPVLAEWLAERARTNRKRVDHNKLQTGKL